MKIALSGVAGAGKDYFASALISKGYKRLAFGDQLKKIAAQIFDWLEEDYEPYEKEKELNITTELNEKISLSPRDIWLEVGKLKNIEKKLFIRKLHKELQNTNGDIVISDVRTKDEFDYVKSQGFITILIEPIKHIYEIRDYDRQIYDFKNEFDYVFVNKFNGAEEFLSLINRIENEKDFIITAN